MDRRTFLAAASAGLAGCGSVGSSPSTDEAPTPTPTGTSPSTDEAPTPTPTGTSTPTTTPPERRYLPQMLDVALVSRWGGAGDLIANRIEHVRRGQPAVVAFRYRIRIPSGTINLKEGVDVVYRGDLVDRRSRDTDRNVDSPGLHIWEDAVTFETGDWPTGELTASVAVGELQLHRTSESVETTFEVTSD
mgnify:CR=1 FL=1